ncbi:coniferyl aldehyde dehydrogenase [Sulfitobacter sp. F26169L]|uniref:coniferyl aldehyde dehydrogenase n=1 Tax=Sulfitobacter sp. F26169L TaxID=2996015 RepID=UPI0022609F19|nr:coniferyl aldehyde dehydrogenase [Sulfitobacter sp. F26169L]MCX7567909.1 coniferyl aldehyde dehydrogenase [Sulfitobacter sp. F26169L]
MKDTTLTMQDRFDAMMDAHKRDPNPDYATRKDRLERLEQALHRFSDDLVAAMMQDFSHRSPSEAATFDVTIPIGDVRMNRRKLRSWMRPRRYHMPKHLLPARGRVLPQPKGVVGVIAPWNFPVYLAVGPLSAALAAGNRVMLKPSELTPRTSEVIAQMIAEVFEPNEVAVLTGGPEIAAAFSELPFGHLLFTGSTQVGRKVAQAAAKNLTPVTLELGGKSPAIVGEHADLAYAAKRIAFGKTTNGGQVCVSPDYALVPRNKMHEFAGAVEGVMKDFFPDVANSTDYTAIVSDRHQQRLQDMIKEAEERGANVVRVGDTSQANTRKVAPALLIDPPLDIKAMQEEIFGPILPIIPYDTREEAMQFVADRASPLALYIFTDQHAERDAWLSKSLSGGACVNETSFHVVADSMPFGGVGDSGMGSYHGKAGFDTFSHLKSVFYQPKLNASFLFNPPVREYQHKVGKILRKII